MNLSTEQRRDFKNNPSCILQAVTSHRIEISGEKGHQLFFLRSPPQKKDGTPLLSCCCRDDKRDERNLLIECHSVPAHIVLHLACEL